MIHYKILMIGVLLLGILNAQDNPLEKYIYSINYDSEKYSRLFLINELMGKEYVLHEIQGLSSPNGGSNVEMKA